VFASERIGKSRGQDPVKGSEEVMPDSSSKKGPQLDDEMKREAADLEHSRKESHVEEEREEQGDDDAGLTRGHRVSGSGTSGKDYPYRDHGEEGGASHPKPKSSD
jgi:hypothetical protein